MTRLFWPLRFEPHRLKFLLQGCGGSRGVGNMGGGICQRISARLRKKRCAHERCCSRGLGARNDMLMAPRQWSKSNHGGSAAPLTPRPVRENVLANASPNALLYPTVHGARVCSLPLFSALEKGLYGRHEAAETCSFLLFSCEHQVQSASLHEMKFFVGTQHEKDTCRHPRTHVLSSSFV